MSQEIQLFDTLNKNLFYVRNGGRPLKVYVCGPTVYTDTHIGHIKTYLTFDIMRSVLEYLGISMFYMMNITNVDDKIIKATYQKEYSLHDNFNFDDLKDNQILPNQKFVDFADYWEKDFFSVLDQLNIKRPNIVSRVTDYIDEIFQFVEEIDNKGFVFEDNGSVYFYGTKYNNNEGWSKDPIDPLNFVLLKKTKKYEPGWDSKWGNVRPGWHIECSTMASSVFGSKIDIHGGGIDLKFPHHHNEVLQSNARFGYTQSEIGSKLGTQEFHGYTQSEIGSKLGTQEFQGYTQSEIGSKLGTQEFHGYTQSEIGYKLGTQEFQGYTSTDNMENEKCGWVDHWCHFGHLNVDIDGIKMKMSRSLKNFITASEILQKNTPDQLRMLFLLHRWNESMDYSNDTMKHAIHYTNSFTNFFVQINSILLLPNVKENKKFGTLEIGILDVLSKTMSDIDISLRNNIDTPSSIKYLDELIKVLYIYVTESEYRNEMISKEILIDISTYVKKILSVFGLTIISSSKIDDSECSNKLIKVISDIRIELRNTAKIMAQKLKPIDQTASKEIPKDLYALTDKIRDVMLPEIGIKLVDK